MEEETQKQEESKDEPLLFNPVIEYRFKEVEQKLPDGSIRRVMQQVPIKVMDI